MRKMAAAEHYAAEPTLNRILSSTRGIHLGAQAIGIDPSRLGIVAENYSLFGAGYPTSALSYRFFAEITKIKSSPNL
jgi:hypothetical protein